MLARKLAGKTEKGQRFGTSIAPQAAYAASAELCVTDMPAFSQGRSPSPYSRTLVVTYV